MVAPVVLPLQLFGAEQHLVLAAQQVATGLQQLTVWIWHGAGAAAVAHGAGVAWAQQVTFGALQHLTFAGLQQSLASAAPLNAARTARVALNATNFIDRLMLSPFPCSMMAWPLGPIEANKRNLHGTAVQDDSRPTILGR